MAHKSKTSTRFRSDAERAGMIDSLRCYREEPTEYQAPEELDKMFALYAIGTMKLSSSAKAVATALIWHANYHTGRCDPGIGRLVCETGLCDSAVKKAIKELVAAGVIRCERRQNGTTNSTNAYHLNWNTLRKAFAKFEELAGRVNKSGGGVTNVTPPGSQTCPTLGHDRDPKHLNRTLEENTRPERAHRSRDGAILNSPNGKGEQEAKLRPEPKQREILYPINGAKQPAPTRRNREKARAEIYDDLKANTSAEQYQDTLAQASPTDEEAAILEQLRRPGQGWALLYSRALTASLAPKPAPRRATA